MNEEAVQSALAALNQAHDADPGRRQVGEQWLPVERVWCDRVQHWVAMLDPRASAALRLAAAAQHLERWRSPRSDWPAGRSGYLQWRKAQQRAHAARAGELLVAAGCDEALMTRVGELIRKEGIRRDPEAATLEDAACLTFLELDLDDFAARHERADVLRILRKTWQKLSPAGQDAARQLPLSDYSAELVGAALAPATVSE